MIDEAHARGIRVVLDGVFNHASRGFFPFHDIMENGPNSAYLDWFTVKEFPLYAYDAEKAPNYNAWWGLPALPKFNTDSPEVREFLWGIGRKLDGVRHRRLAARRPQRDRRRRLLARVPPPRPGRQPRGVHRRRGLGQRPPMAPGRHVGRRDELPVHPRVHRVLHRRGRQLRGPVQDEPPSGRPPGAGAFRRAIERLIGLYHPNVTAVMLNLLGSHDMARFVTLANGDRSALRLATCSR